MFRSVFGVILPSLLNFFFVILFVRLYGSASYDEYVYLMSLIGLPNSLLFQPFVARIKTKLINQDKFIFSLYVFYAIVSFSAFLLFSFHLTFLNNIFISLYIYSFSLVGLEKTISNIRDLSSWLPLQISIPTTLIIWMSFSKYFNLNYKIFLTILTAILLILILILIIRRLYILNRIEISFVFIKFFFDKRLFYLVIAGTAVYMSTNFFKILIYNNTKDEGVLFNYDLLQKFLVMYSSFFLIQYGRIAFRKKINPNRVIKQYCIGGLLLIFLIYTCFEEILQFIFNIHTLSVSSFELTLIIFNLLAVGIMPIYDTYYNSKEKYKCIFYLYFTYLFLLVFATVLLELFSGNYIVNFSIASIFSTFISIIMSRKWNY